MRDTMTLVANFILNVNNQRYFDVNYLIKSYHSHYYWQEDYLKSWFLKTTFKSWLCSFHFEDANHVKDFQLSC